MRKGPNGQCAKNSWAKDRKQNKPKVNFQQESIAIQLKGIQRSKIVLLFIRNPLKYEICSNSVVVSDNLNVIHVSAVFLFGQYQYLVPGNVHFLSDFHVFCPNFK